MTAPSPADVSAVFSTLLPGDELFPPAGELGLAGTVAARLEQTAPGLHDRVLGALAGAAAMDEAARVDALEALEATVRADFDAFLSTLFLVYYETDAVHAAITATGKRYHAAPQPDGYQLPPFRPDDAPGHGTGQVTGWYLATDAVRRVDVPPGLDN